LISDGSSNSLAGDDNLGIFCGNSGNSENKSGISSVYSCIFAAIFLSSGLELLGIVLEVSIHGHVWSVLSGSTGD
jgi:hypothetical protein